MSNIQHSDLATGVIHIVANWVYANAAARTGASGFVTGDIGKVAWQQDNDTFWVLKATTPTWAGIGGGGSDATISISDITTNNASTSAHGFLKKLSGSSSDFMNGVGNWAVPSGGGGGGGAIYSTDIGDGSSTSFTVTHSLGTKDVSVSVYDKNTGEFVSVHVVATSTSVVTISNFLTVPTSNQYRVIVQSGGTTVIVAATAASVAGLEYAYNNFT